jgi:hypothetical protein
MTGKRLCGAFGGVIFVIVSMLTAGLVVPWFIRFFEHYWVWVLGK